MDFIQEKIFRKPRVYSQYYWFITLYNESSSIYRSFIGSLSEDSGPKKNQTFFFPTENISEEHNGWEKLNKTKTLELEWKLR